MLYALLPFLRPPGVRLLFQIVKLEERANKLGLVETSVTLCKAAADCSTEMFNRRWKAEAEAEQCLSQSNAKNEENANG